MHEALCTMDWGLCVVEYVLTTTHGGLVFTAHCAIGTRGRVPGTVLDMCMMPMYFAFFRALRTMYHALCNVYLAYAMCHVLSNGHHVLCTMHEVLWTVHCFLCTAHCKLCTVHYVLSTVHHACRAPCAIRTVY